jgi:ribosomal-protein-serine acetyltransferase
MNPILLDFPDFFTTPRLLVRALRAGDGAALNTAINESLPEMQAWMTWAQAEHSLEQDEEFVRRWLVKFQLREELPFFIFDRHSQDFVGSMSLHHIDWDAACFEIGYWVRTRYAGQGYISETLRGMINYGFEQLNANRLEIRCDALNTRSQAVAERAGFQLEGRLRQNAMNMDDGLRDTLIFGLLRSEWTPNS